MKYVIEQSIHEFYTFNNRMPKYLIMPEKFRSMVCKDIGINTGSDYFKVYDLICKFDDTLNNCFPFDDNTVEIEQSIKFKKHLHTSNIINTNIDVYKVMDSLIQNFKKEFKKYPRFCLMPSIFKDLVTDSIDKLNDVCKDKPSSHPSPYYKFFMVLGVRCSFTFGSRDFIFFCSPDEVLKSERTIGPLEKEQLSKIMSAYADECVQNTINYKKSCVESVYSLCESDYDKLVLQTAAFLSGMADLSDEGRLDTFKFQEIASELSIKLLAKYSKHTTRKVFTSQYELIKDLEKSLNMNTHFTEDNSK